MTYLLLIYPFLCRLPPLGEVLIGTLHPGGGTLGGGGHSGNSSVSSSSSFGASSSDAPHTGSSQHLQFYQLNVHRAQLPSYELFQKLAPHSVALIQEPWFHKGKLLGLLPHLRGIYSPQEAGGPPPKAAIVAHDSVDLLPLPQFTTFSVVAAIWTTSSTNQCLRQIVLISWYWHADDDFPSVLEELYTFMELHHLEHVLCTDSNAHSDLWRARRTDLRGRQLEEFLSMNMVTVLNNSPTPTFVGPMGHSHIDVTGVSPLLIDRAARWVCGGQPSFSDHNLITFVLKLPVRKQLIRVRCLKSCLWEEYSERLGRRTSRLSLPSTWTVETLDIHAELFREFITDALDAVAPKGLVLKDKTYKWWSDDLFRSRQMVRALLHQAQLHNDPDHWDSYKQQLRDYKLLIKTTKRSSWQKFTSASDNISLQARLNKIIYSETRITLGSIRSGDTYTRSLDDSFRVLLKEHFPGCTGMSGQPLTRPSIEGLQTPLCRIPWISPSLIRRAVSGFAVHKTPGPDEVYPECLRHLPEQMIDYLATLFRASVSLSYVPRAWKLARVVFIPKSGKADYGDPRSFRPITLTSFILKTLERLVQWQLEATELRLMPLHRNQFGFRKGLSTEHAISKTLSTLENLKRSKKPAIAIFLDIKGAFDNVSYTSLHRGLTKRGVNSTAVAWYFNLLTERTTFAENPSSGHRTYIQHHRGVPQGGILSPTMWNIAFDEYITGVSEIADDTTAYADDVCIILTGDTYLDAHIKARRALRFTERWSVRNNISFCPKKTEYINYLWQDGDPPFDEPLQLYGSNITETSSFKYLGLTFNSALTWSQHITSKVQKAKFLMKHASTTFGKIWGPSPKMIQWTLEAMVTPKILYASHAWHAYTYKSKIKLQLRQLTRLALLQMSPCRLHTPTAGLELITHTIPLYLRAREKNVFTLMRIMEFKLDRLLSSAHVQTLFKELRSSGLSHCRLDRIPAEFVLDRKYLVNEAPRDDPIISWPHNLYTLPPARRSDLHIYTDGSKLDDDGRWGTGGGYVFYRVQPGDQPPGMQICAASLTICHTQTVFQAEIRAISEAARTFLRLRAERQITLPRNITFFTDSQAALAALSSASINARSVMECHYLLNDVARHTSVTLRWIKAHVGHAGNEMADSLAKQGAMQPFPEIGPGPFGWTPHSLLKKVMRSYLMDTWEKDWTDREPCRQTKIWFPKPHPRKGRVMIKLKRLTLGTVTRWITGHNFLRRHQNLLEPDVYATPTCRLCHSQEETSSHLLLECPVLDDTRLKFFHHRRPKPPFPWEVHQLVDFLDFFAETMEDTSPEPKILQIFHTIHAKRDILLEPLEIPPDPSDLDSDATSSNDSLSSTTPPLPS